MATQDRTRFGKTTPTQMIIAGIIVVTGGVIFLVFTTAVIFGLFDVALGLAIMFYGGYKLLKSENEKP